MAINHGSVYKTLFLLTLFCLLLTTLADNQHQCQPCGQQRQGHKAVALAKPRQRIVGGYEVTEHRPWMAYIEISAMSKFHCGGSIINSLFILSAAHCACDALPCLVNDKNELTVNYEPKGKLKAFLGFRRVGNKAKDKNNVYDVVSVKVHAEYRQDFHDLALFQVDRAIGFSPKVSPICLPPNEGFFDLSPVGYVAGWGHLTNSGCHTNSHGPSPFAPCIFPFKWNNEVFTSCAKDSPTPSESNLICKKLTQMSNITSVGPELHVQVRSSLTKKTLATCFNTEPGSTGWCVTCDHNLDPSHPNSCSTGQDKAYPEVKVDRDWGFCQDRCQEHIQAQSKIAQTLNEVKLTIFDPLTCANYLKKTNTSYNVAGELCAGRLNQRFISNLFVAPSPSGMSVDTSITMDPQVEHIVGGHDSCLGDSGGPLWIHHGQQAVLVGVVSRGLNCANADAPGIYVRVTAYLNWIHSNSKDGNCTQAAPVDPSSSNEMLSFL